MEMIGGLEKVLGVTATIERHPEQPGDVPQTWASLEKARRMLGYDPRTNYADGVRRFASWLEGVLGRQLEGQVYRAGTFAPVAA